MDYRSVLLKGILLTCTLGLTTGFIPNAFRLDVADLIFDANGQSFTHADMTRGALLAILADVLIDNPNPTNENSTRDIQNLGSVGVSCLIDAYYGRSGDLAAIRGQQKVLVERTIDDIGDFNSRTDTDEVDSAAAHFDSEQFEDAQQRLVEFREIVVMEISRRNYASARRFMGRLLHTLQDFYSHSNWIEIADSRGMSNPSPNLALGVRGRSVGNTAGPTRPTCTNCNRIRTVPIAKLFGLLPFIGSDALYDCRDNIESTVLAEGVLTTGYADGGRDSQNRRISKPNGKCSHGGIIDETQDSPATGGINKDSTHAELASHYFFHGRAATTAQEHSRVMFSMIRGDVNDDELFGGFLGVELEVNRVVSFAVVVDTTIPQGTNDEIVALVSQVGMDVQQYINTFENDLQVQYILVSVSDTVVDSTFETVDLSQLLTAIDGLSLQSSGDGNVPTIEAILHAARASEPDSSIFVFTDSSPSDENLLGQAEAIVARKNLRVVFIHDASSLNKRSTKQLQMSKLRPKRQSDISLVYKELEIFSGGETITVPRTEISDLAVFVSFSAIQSNNVIFRRAATLSGNTEHYFLVDSYTFQILILINGQSITVSSVTTPQGTDATVLSEYRSNTLYIATINTTDSTLSGRWTIVLTSQGSYSIQVLGDGELTFLSDVITIRPNTTDDINDLKPLVGLDMSAELIIVGSTTPVNITALDIINEGGVIQSVANVSRMGDSYVSMFTPPQVEFKMQVTGVDDNGYNFTYISDISIEPTSISLTFGENDNGYLTLRPGTGSAITVVLLNTGASQRFRISVITDTSIDDSGVQYTINNENPFVSQNSQVDITVNVFFSNNVPVGLGVTFTVVAQSENSFDVNDFINFDAVNIREVVSGSPDGVMYVPLLKMNLLITSMILLLLLHDLL